MKQFLSRRQMLDLRVRGFDCGRISEIKDDDTYEITIGEIIAFLPMYINSGRPQDPTARLDIRPFDKGWWSVSYSYPVVIQTLERELIDALFGVLISLIDNGYIKDVDDETLQTDIAL